MSVTAKKQVSILDNQKPINQKTANNRRKRFGSLRRVWGRHERRTIRGASRCTG